MDDASVHDFCFCFFWCLLSEEDEKNKKTTYRVSLIFASFQAIESSVSGAGPSLVFLLKTCLSQAT